MEKKVVSSHTIYCETMKTHVIIVVYEDGSCECKWASRVFRDCDGKWVGNRYLSWEDEQRCRACPKNKMKEKETGRPI